MFKPIEGEFLYIYPSVVESRIFDSLFALITFIIGRIIDNKNNTNKNDLYPPEK